ncbi:YceD family protein [Roseibium sp.]|uniref:YceD family protein n=1 Tax=Roseibium sp. TaxID=1936156 RepID=UPI003A96C501
MTGDKFPFSHKVNAERLGDREETVVIEPDTAALKRIAEANGCVDIGRLCAELTLKPWRKAGVRVVGKLEASITQQCVVTLEPFEQELSEDIDRTFEPVSSRPRRPRDLNEEGEIEIELETLDPPDVMVDGVIDLGALVCEQLALSIDPFPRKPGAVFERDEETDSSELEDKPSPFAALAKLKQDPEQSS